MKYLKHKVDEQYLDYVECLISWDCHFDNEKIIETPPNAHGAIIFNIKTPCRVTSKLEHYQLVPSVFITGQATSYYQLHVNGPLHQVGIVFKPSGIYNFLGNQMSKITDRRLPLQQFLPNKTSMVHQKLLYSTTENEWVEILSSFIDDIWEDAGHSDPLIVKACNQILDEIFEYKIKKAPIK